MVSKRFARDACARILRPETSASRIFSPGPKRTTSIAPCKPQSVANRHLLGPRCHQPRDTIPRGSSINIWCCIRHFGIFMPILNLYNELPRLKFRIIDNSEYPVIDRNATRLLPFAFYNSLVRNAVTATRPVRNNYKEVLCGLFV